MPKSHEVLEVSRKDTNSSPSPSRLSTDTDISPRKPMTSLQSADNPLHPNSLDNLDQTTDKRFFMSLSYRWTNKFWRRKCFNICLQHVSKFNGFKIIEKNTYYENKKKLSISQYRLRSSHLLFPVFISLHLLIFVYIL